MKAANVDGRFCIVTSAGAVDVATASAGRFGPAPRDIYEQWPDFQEWVATADLHEATPLDHRRLGPPSPEPVQIFAIGLNYQDHADESGTSVPPSPATFTKFRSSLCGPSGVLALPDGKVDWEIELVVVIGRPAHRVAAVDAWDYIAGFTIGQDYSERARQLEGDAPQYSLAKSFPGFAPTGPVLVTLDELGDPMDLQLECRVNDEVVQRERTSSLIFSVPELVSRLSAVCQLYPGDLVFTGTPAGVGAGMNPPRFLADGDIVTSRIEGIGEMQQLCIPASHS